MGGTESFPESSCRLVADTHTIEQAVTTGHMASSEGMNDTPPPHTYSQKARRTGIDALQTLEDDGGDDPRLGCAKYYRLQSSQELGSYRIPAPVYFAASLHDSWLTPLRDGIQAINEAAPGLHVYQVGDEKDAKVKVNGNDDGGCWISGNIILKNVTIISFEKDWSSKNGTAIHEMMHALGFEHEQKRKDGEKYMTYDTSGLDKHWKRQYKLSKYVTGLNRFDPHSIMMYPLDCNLNRKSEGDTVWKTKAGDERCQVLSELDKVGLNILYRPVSHDGYRPRISSVTGLYYCGRSIYVNTENDVVKQAHTDGVCGPNNWANCAACRVIKTKKSEDIRALGKWQGWTGLVYCGKYFGRVNSYHDGYCGPNNGPPCKDCGELLYPGYTGDWTSSGFT